MGMTLIKKKTAIGLPPGDDSFSNGLKCHILLHHLYWYSYLPTLSIKNVYTAFVIDGMATGGMILTKLDRSTRR